MSLAAPLALAWAALTVPIVIFYILKIRLRREPVSTTIFWRQIYDEKQPRSLWRILRHLISLLIQIAWLLLLVLALTEPFFKGQVLRARRLILVVDNSASMRASDVNPSRLDVAKQLGRQAIASLRFQDEMAIVSAGAQPTVVCGLTGHERTLRTALDKIRPTDGPTRVPAAIDLGKRLIADAKHGRVIVLTDGCFPDSEKLLTDDGVELRAVGTRVANVGISNFQVRRSLLDPLGYEILTEVTNSADEPVECRLEIDLHDEPVDVIPLALSPGQTWSKAIEKTSVNGGVLAARLEHSDTFITDNSALALLPQRTEQRIVLVGENNLFLRKVLEVNPLVRLSTTTSLPTQYDPDVLYVFHKSCPQTLPAVRMLVIDPTENSDLWKLGEKLENPIVTKQDADSPLMRHVRIDNVLLPEARQLTPLEGARILVTSLSGDPLYFSVEQGGRKALVLTVNLDQGDLTFRTAFPILATNALSWFAGKAGELRESLASGSITDVELPASVGTTSQFVCRSPTGIETAMPAGVSRSPVGPLDECGIWRIVKAVPSTEKSDTRNIAESAPVAEFACNLANRAESDLRVPSSLLQKRPQTILAAGWFMRPLWFYLVAAAWLLATAEWYLYQRRWIS